MIVCIFCAAVLGIITREEADDEYKLKLPLGLQKEALYLPLENTLTHDKIALGKQLFFDQRLSRDHTVACASCHNPRFGFTDGQSVPTGIEGQQGRRSTSTILNRAFSKEQFWDGRATDLEDQAKKSMVHPVEMGFTHDGVIERLRGIKGYREQFEKTFGTGGVIL